MNYDIQSILQTQYQQGWGTQRSGDISKATEAKSQLQPLTAESEAPVTFKYWHQNWGWKFSACKGAKSPTYNWIVAPLDDLAMLYAPNDLAPITYSS